MREATSIINIAYPGHGKTTRTIAQMNALAGKTGRILIVEDEGVEQAWHKYDTFQITKPSDFGKIQGIKRIFLPDDANQKKRYQLRAQFFWDLDKYYRNGVLVLDDCKTYLNSFPVDGLQKTLKLRRAKMIDIIANAHGFTEVPPVFYTFVEEIYLGLTTDNPNRKIANLPYPDKMIKIKEYVDHMASTENKYFFFKIPVLKMATLTF